MIVREQYVFPSHCRLCTGSTRPLIDTERDYDSDGYGGNLYICHTCVGEMARLFGFSHPERVDDLEVQVDEANARLDAQETENADLAAELAVLKEAISTAANPAPKRAPGRPRKAVSDA